MEILTQKIKLCQICNNWQGEVTEKYNGQVLVHCACTLEAERLKYGHWRSPCMICPNGDKFWWTPISDHLAEDGRWWHTAHFAGPALNRKEK